MNYSTKLMLTALAATTVICADAQVTTSAINGLVLDDNKEPVIGATVTAVHEPSGTLYGTVTNMDGRYTIQGMRTGGPYKVEVSYVRRMLWRRPVLPKTSRQAKLSIHRRLIVMFTM